MAEMSMVERVANAMDDAELGYSIRLVRLGDGESTYELTDSDRGPALSFSSHAGAAEFIKDKNRLAKARAAIEAMALPEITEETFYEIEEAAAKKMRKWERGYVCQDIRIQHSMVWWVAKEVESRFRAALSEEVAG